MFLFNPNTENYCHSSELPEPKQHMHLEGQSENQQSTQQQDFALFYLI